MSEVEKLFQLKEELCKERDLCAELCNIWLTKMHRCQTDEVKYEKYLTLINDNEPYTQELKLEISELNKKICQLEGVESITDTPYTHSCVSKYGFDSPKL
jgi:hypothetical protein